MKTVDARGVVPVHRDPTFGVNDDNLPPSTLERYEKLVEARDAAFMGVRGSYERADELRHAKAAAEGELARLEDYARRSMLFREAGRQHDPLTGVVAVSREPDTARLDAARKRAEVARERYERQLNSHDALAEAHRSIGRLVGRVEQYLQTHRERIEAVEDVTPPKLMKNESVADAVERVRSRIGALLAEAKMTARAPTTTAEAKAKMRSIVAQMASAGRPDVSGLFSRAAAIRWPVVITPELNVNGYLHRTIDAAGVMAFVSEAALIERLDREIDAVGEEIAGAMPTADRERRLREIADETLRLGFEEQALIDMAAESGHVIVPRGSADVRAVLGLSPDAPPPKE